MDSRTAHADISPQQLQSAMKAVGQAIQLDSSGNSRDAYLHYLSCMQYISQCLLQDARHKVAQPTPVSLKSKSAARMVKLAQQCSERVVDLMNNMDETPAVSTATPSSPPPPNLSASFATPHPPSPTPPTPHPSSLSASLPVPAGRLSPSMFPSVPSSFSHAAPTHVAVVRPTVQQPGQQSSTIPPVIPARHRDETLGPLEKAYRENRKLMSAYKSRLNKMQTGRNKSLVNLTFQRRLMENMAIAKAREASLAKKIKERQQRLQEQAAQRFSSSGQPTREELELRMVYADIMEYENVKAWLQEWRKRLQDSPSDLKLIHDLITKILSCEEHPLTQILKRYQISIYHKIMPLIQRNLPSIEEIVVPYKDVVALHLDLEEARAVPEGGFTTPDELDESIDSMLAKRLGALRENSSSSVESENSESRQLSQTDSLLFSPSEVSDDVLEELLSEEDACDHSNGREDGVSGERRRVARSEGGEEEDADDCRGGDNLNDSGIQNGEELSSDDGLPSKKTGDGGSCHGEEEENDSDVVDRMKDIVTEIGEEVEEAIEDGDRLCEELEKGETSICDNENTTDDTNLEESGNDTAATNGDIVLENSNHSRTDLEPSDESETRTSGIGRGVETSSRLDSASCADSVCRETEESKEDNGDLEQSIGDEKASSDESKERRVGEEVKEVEEDGEERIAEMRAEALKRHLKSISKDVLMFTERLQSLLVAVYEQLNSTVAREQCIAVIEAFFFKDIWQPLLMLFRRFNFKKEESAAIAMTMYSNAMPQHIGVQEKFCLLNEGTLQDGDGSPSGYPYQPVVEELCKLQGYTCPLQKLECIVRVSRGIIECVEDFYEKQGKPRQSPETTVGCDDLLPILSYVIMKSAMPQIVSECSAMEEFIHEGYLFGEEGYCLTTCQTALSYVLKLGSETELLR